MPQALYGADIEALRRLADTIARGSNHLDGVSTTVESALPDPSVWSGPDAEMFLEEWHASHAPALQAASQAVAEAAETAFRNADEQESTSDGGVEGGLPYAPRSGGSTPPSGGDSGDPQGGVKPPKDDDGNYGTPEEIDPPVDLSIEAFNRDNIAQGSIGDCWLLSSLGAVAQNDPEFLQEHISYDKESDTYTVTLYEDGEPVDVTVDSTALSSQARGEDGEYSWVTIYEKAIAAQMGGDFEHLNADQPEKAMEYITGQDADQNSHSDVWLNPFDGPPSAGDIREDLDAGNPVVAHTSGDLDHDSIVGGHAYTVTNVAEDGSVTVMNPWGESGAGDDHYVTLSEAEFQETFVTTTTGEAP